MRKLLKWLIRLILVLVVFAGIAFVHVWYFKPYKIDWFYARVFGQFALQSPQMLSSMRILPPWADFYSGKLDDASPAHADRMAAMVKDDLDMLHRYDRDALDEEGKLSYDALEFFLADQVEGDRFRFHDFPVNQMFGVQSGQPNFMAQTHQVNNAGDAENYISRLDRFPLNFSQVIDGLKLREGKGVIPPKFTVDKVLEQMNGFIGVPAEQNMLYTSFGEKLDRIAADAMDTATREDLKARVKTSIEASVYPAFRELIAYFTTLQAKATQNQGAWSLPDGDAYYAWCVRSHTTTDMTPEQVHELGLAEVARISAEMDEILRGQGLTEGSVGARVQQLARQPEQMYPNTPEGKTAMIARYQAILDDVNAKLGDAFNRRPKLGVEVKPVPAFSEKTAPGAYYQSGSFDGSRPGVFYANLRDPGETPKFAMRTLAYHEGIPGHHFQITIAQELQGVPFFRRVLPFTAYSEGWALYAERLAWEMGFEQDPLDNLGRLRDEMMRAVRLVVDSGIHYKRWTREQAITYMLDNTGMGEGDVTAEIERYFVNPGQALAYKAGMLKILALREKARKELGDRFSLGAFHDQVLSHGALPLSLLERVIDDWIAKTKAG
ncbi:DUF885 domain-containing protein [Dokdonella immobilis]|uniref:Uncharacterized conserved protein, DUF885 familyt n=1 Tax=Dokdonella immobilis TaxID=578942 RepID=A0A1I4V8M6_9GAMM|nr:DUF885 domain-containing protein [Dokdonella immobilis]SFM97547.1 Uncharacterized conserved protein, DUF885 familyt [Dokdonella immobilis]